MKKIKRYQKFVIEILKNWKLSKPLLNNMEAIMDGMKYGSNFKNLSSESPSISPPNSLPSNPLADYFDKNTEGHGIWKWSHYFEMYHSHLQKFVGKSPIVVEVGVYSGGSLPMWSKYFGNGTHIHGIDIEPECMIYQNDTTTIHIGDQENPVFWRKFFTKVPKVDIFIDDGGHAPNQQRITLEEVLPRIQPGGVYICEDIHSESNAFYWFFSGILGNLNCNKAFFLDNGESASKSADFQKWIKSVSFYPYAVVIEKHLEPVPILHSPRRGTIWQPFLDRFLK